MHAGTHVSTISKMMQYGTSEKACGDKSGIPVIRMGNIQEGKLSFENLKYYPKNWSELNEFILHDGDVLFNRTNSKELVGKAAVYTKNYPPAVFASYLIRIRLRKNIYEPILLTHYINSYFGKQYIASVVSQQVGQANVNGTKLGQMFIPLMSIEEQHQIVSEIEVRFSVADQIESIVDASLKQSERLRQSILRKAFEGKLVPQDPNDEPAARLLERIRLERVERQNTKDNYRLERRPMR